MNYAHLAAAAALTLALGGSALAQDSDVATFETTPAARSVRGGGLAASGSNEAYPTAFVGRSVPVVAGAGLVLPAGGSEGAVQTAASLPGGFSDGTVAYAQAQSIARFFAEREGRQQTRLAAAAASQRPGGSSGG